MLLLSFICLFVCLCVAKCSLVKTSLPQLPFCISPVKQYGFVAFCWVTSVDSCDFSVFWSVIGDRSFYHGFCTLESIWSLITFQDCGFLASLSAIKFQGSPCGRGLYLIVSHFGRFRKSSCRLIWRKIADWTLLRASLSSDCWPKSSDHRRRLN